MEKVISYSGSFRLRTGSATNLSDPDGWTPQSEPAADKPSETKAFPQPSPVPPQYSSMVQIGNADPFSSVCAGMSQLQIRRGYRGHAKSRRTVAGPIDFFLGSQEGPVVENRVVHPTVGSGTLSATTTVTSPTVGHRESNSDWVRGFQWRLRISDFFITLAVIATAFSWQFGFAGFGSTRTPLLEYSILSVILVLVWNADLGIYRTRERNVIGAGVVEYRRVLNSTTRSIGAPAILIALLDMELVRGFFAVALPLGIISLVANHWIWRHWLSLQRLSGRFLSEAVVVGESKDVQYVITQLTKNLSTGYKVAGVALISPLNPTPSPVSLQAPWYRISAAASAEDIAAVVERTGARTLIVAGKLPGGPAAVQELSWRLGDISTELVLASSLTNVAGPRVHFRPVEGLPLMHVELPQYSGGKHIIKRAMDILLSAAALILLSPVLGILTVVVRLDSHGPAFFHQERVGRNGHPFTMMKFRSMTHGAEHQLAALAGANEADGVLFKIANDPRVTRCGRWMRKFSLDELPQFWNVIKGDMSLVGPRPPLAAEVAGYERPVHRRLLIKPGITGLWQVSGRSDLEWSEAVRLDLYYVENWSLTGDIIILWRTLKAVSSSNGAY